MAEKSSDQDKTEEPTSYKLQKAREDGNVSISKEVSSVFLMTSALTMFMSQGDKMYEKLKRIFELFFMNAGKGFSDQDEAISYLGRALYGGLDMIMPILSILFVTALGINLLQTKGMFSTKAMAFKGSKMNPLSGLKKIFSSKGLIELFKGLMKLGVILSIGYFTVKSEVDHFVAFIVTPLEGSMSQTGTYLIKFVTRIMIGLLAYSIMDALYQRYQHRKELMMTKQEIKDEYKQMEGDPHVKSQRRQFGLKLRRQKRLDHAVLTSDVVVTNPTHYAVALRYDPQKSDAPIVVVKGQRLRALRIKELAKHYGIPIVENVPVARALFATVEEDDFIPADMFRAVAEILAYVYKLKNKKLR